MNNMVNINFAFDPAASLYYWGILRSWIRTQSASCVYDDEVIITGLVVQWKLWYCDRQGLMVNYLPNLLSMFSSFIMIN